MSEIINTYLVNDPESLVPMKRSDFYQEQVKIFKETGNPTRACDIIDILIFNSDGELMVQKRSKNKAHNPGMFDKSIGGHVSYGDTYSHTVMIETVQELQTPSIVLNNKKDFDKTLSVLSEYTETIAIIKHNDSETHRLTKIINGEKIDILNRVHLYFGIYNGRTRPVDKEANGVLYYTIEDLVDEMRLAPHMFSYDLSYLINTYKNEIVNFIEKVKTQK